MHNTRQQLESGCITCQISLVKSYLFPFTIIYKGNILKNQKYSYNRQEWSNRESLKLSRVALKDEKICALVSTSLQRQYSTHCSLPPWVCGKAAHWSGVVGRAARPSKLEHPAGGKRQQDPSAVPLNMVFSGCLCRWRSTLCYDRLSTVQCKSSDLVRVRSPSTKQTRGARPDELVEDCFLLAHWNLSPIDVREIIEQLMNSGVILQ